MRHYTTVLAALFMIGCGTNPGTDRDSGDPIGNDTDSTPSQTGTVVGQTTIGGEDVVCQVCITGDDGTDVAKSTGEAIPVPAGVMLNIMAGNEAVGTDCEETPRPLHAHTDGTLWTYEHITEMVEANETLAVKIPLNRFLLGYYTYIVESWGYNEETGQYDIPRPTEEIDEAELLKTYGGKWIVTNGEGNADQIAGTGNDGKFYTIDAEFAFESTAGFDDYVEDSWMLEDETFWFRLVQDEFMATEVTGMLVMRADCADE